MSQSTLHIDGNTLFNLDLPVYLCLSSLIIKFKKDRIMKSIWFNLPVKNIEKSKTFFKAIGFRENPMHSKADHLASFFIGEKDVVMMLFPEDSFKSFTQNDVCNTSIGTEVLLNIDAQSKAEVDKMAEKVRESGGKIYVQPGESQGWMYAFGFEDLDGHRWSMLYMDMDKMPQQ